MIHSVAELEQQLCFFFFFFYVCEVWVLCSCSSAQLGLFFLNLLLKVEVGCEDVPVFSVFALQFLGATPPV